MCDYLRRRRVYLLPLAIIIFIIVYTDALKPFVSRASVSMDRLVHLDMKGAAPKLTYMAVIFPLFKTLGATGLLIEWEDTFPYSGDLETLSALDCYTKEDVKEIHRLAKANGLFIIPLIQTFGHMEFVLKGPKFKHLREHPVWPQVINPHKQESMDLIKRMIDQQMELQPDVQYIHIGCDEVWALGSSDESKRLIESGTLKDTIFLSHVRNIASYTKSKYSTLEVLIWDDMLRSAASSTLQSSGISGLISPVVWGYEANVDKRLNSSILIKYATLFPSSWIATAFKGSTGSDAYITPIKDHYENHVAWLRVLKSVHKSKLNVKGTILTGWQRYDHFASLCELLPVAIPSLAVCLSTLKHSTLLKTQRTEIDKILGCRTDFLWKADFHDVSPPKCTYPGHELLQGVYALKIAWMMNSKCEKAYPAWHKDYNLRRNFSQSSWMGHIDAACSGAYKWISTAERLMKSGLSEYFGEETTVEWLQTYIKPLNDTITNAVFRIKSVLKLDTWPRRPIHKWPKSP